MAATFAEIRDSIPEALAKAARQMKDPNTPPAVTAQLGQTVEKLIALLPPGALAREEPEADDADREFAREAIRRFCIAEDRPIAEVTAEWRTEADAATAEVERLRAALAEAEALRRRLEEVETRPIATPVPRAVPVRAQDPPAPSAAPRPYEPGGIMSESGGEFLARVERQRRRGGLPDL